jgi:hypothetical protein
MSIEEKIDRIQEDVSDLKVEVGRLKTGIIYIEKSIDPTAKEDHEKRLRNLEAHKNRGLGAVAVISSIIAFVVAAALGFLTKFFAI